MSNQDSTLSRILILRDRCKPGMGVAAKLRRFARSGNFLVVTSADMVSLRPILEEQPISAVVIDVGREVGATLAALRILKGFPAIPLFIFNGFLLPRIEEKAKERKRVHYFESQSRWGDFLTLILAAGAEKNRAEGHGISLMQFRQLLNLEKWNGWVTVSSGADQGKLFFQDGRLIGVATDELTGSPAWKRMAAWEKISAETCADKPPIAIAGIKISAGAQASNKTASSLPGKKADPATAGNIESLHLVRQNKKIALNLMKLNLGVMEIREALAAQLLMTDIYLSNNSRSLVGWNSNPLACSKFSAITRSLIHSLQTSGFPKLGAYYVLDLDDDQLVFIVVRDELQWGFLLKGVKDRLGLLLNIVLPKALKTLDESLAVECSF